MSGAYTPSVCFFQTKNIAFVVSNAIELMIQDTPTDTQTERLTDGKRHKHNHTHFEEITDQAGFAVERGKCAGVP
jgi:hypothetical protein